MRLVKGADGWWCMSGPQVALLPDHGVMLDGATPALSAEAQEALDGSGFFTEQQHAVYSLTVLTSTGCNLGCAYCFQNVHATEPGNFAPERINLARLDDSVIDAIIAFTRGAMAEAGLSDLKLMLFGGEPLLNPRACLSLLDAAASTGLVGAMMVSNGVLLTPKLARSLEERLLRTVQITFDGDKTTHDSVRATRRGRGTFDTILRNVEAASAATSLDWQFRINVSHRNDFSIPDLIELLASRVDPARATVDIALIDDVGIGYDNNLRLDDGFRDEYLSWHLAILETGFSVPTPEAEFFCGYCSVRRGRIGAVVNADGTLYSCWDTAGRPGMEVGDVRTGYLPDDVIDSRWHSCGYNAAPHGDGGHAQRFRDYIDGAVLDQLRERSLLTRT